MKSNKAKVSIFKVGMGDGATVNIRIEDESSGYIITEVEMSLLRYAQASMGLSSQDAKIVYLVHEDKFKNIGKTLEYKKISISTSLYKFSQRDELIEEINKAVPVGWELYDDGINTKQEDFGKHNFSVCRYV